MRRSLEKFAATKLFSCAPKVIRCLVISWRNPASGGHQSHDARKAHWLRIISTIFECVCGHLLCSTQSTEDCCQVQRHQRLGSCRGLGRDVGSSVHHPEAGEGDPRNAWRVPWRRGSRRAGLAGPGAWGRLHLRFMGVIIFRRGLGSMVVFAPSKVSEKISLNPGVFYNLFGWSLFGDHGEMWQRRALIDLSKFYLAKGVSFIAKSSFICLHWSFKKACCSLFLQDLSILYSSVSWLQDLPSCVSLSILFC